MDEKYSVTDQKTGTNQNLLRPYLATKMAFGSFPVKSFENI